ncbi:hypothetical protein GYMLUDRAFT_39757 [Collybiopsis luxurians FD-317 M1]|nr:hypothetical protein GYMLUDRAFT_39757 [Collybiopsis luxurians FD-317 M1]
MTVEASQNFRPYPRHIFLFAHLRTRSNLFMRLLETHPGVRYRLYPFRDAFQSGPECQNELKTKQGRATGIGKSLEEYEQTFAHITFQAGLDALEELLAQAEHEGKVGIIKEHSCFMMDSRTLNSNIGCQRESKPRPRLVDHQLDLQHPDENSEEHETAKGFPTRCLAELPLPNPTFLPDRLAISFIPVFMIRHPAYAFPSALRASASYGAKVFDADFAILATYRFQRMVFEFYRRYYDERYQDSDPRLRNWPIVVDGDRLVNSTRDHMIKFCELVGPIGLEESQIQYSWDAHRVKRNAVQEAFLGVVEESTGIIKNSEAIKPPNLEQETKKWEKEWDIDVARKMRELVDIAIPDYEILLQHSIDA